MLHSCNEPGGAVCRNKEYKAGLYKILNKICQKSGAGRHQKFFMVPAYSDYDTSIFAVILGPSRIQLENALKYEGLGDIQNICIQLNNAIHKNSCSYIPVETYVKQHKTSSKAFDPYPKDNTTSIPLWVVRGSISWDIDEPEEGFYSDFKLNESEELTDQDKELNQELDMIYDQDANALIDKAVENFDELNEGIKDSIYARNMERLNKEYKNKLQALSKNKERKLAAIRDEKNRRMANAKTETEGAKVRETLQAKMDAVRDQYQAAKDNLKTWKEKQAESYRLKKEKGLFNKDRRSAKKDAKEWKSISSKSVSRAESSKIK